MATGTTQAASTAAATADPAVGPTYPQPQDINSALQNILGLLGQAQSAARDEGIYSGQAAYAAGTTSNAQANRQADYLTAAGLNTPNDPSFLQTMMQTTQQQMLQLGALQQERTQFVQSMGGVTGAIDLVFGKGTSTFAYDGMINEVDSALKQSQAAMQNYLANTSTVAAMGQKTIASISMAEAVAKQRALEVQAEQNAIKYELKGQEVMLGALERQEQRDINQERVDKMGAGKATGPEAGKALVAMGLDPSVVKMAGGNANTKGVVDAILRNPTAVMPDNLDPKLNSTADALILHTQAMQGATNPVLKASLDSAFGIGGYAAGALNVARTTFNAQKQANKKYQGLTPSKEAEEIGNMTRMQADTQMLSIDPRDDTNMYRADWNAMATVPSASIFRGPIGQQVLGDVKKLTTAEARRTYNDKIVLERATQMIKSGVLTIDQATEEISSMFNGAVKFNNSTKKYEAVGLLPQTSYMSTLRSSGIGAGAATMRALSNAAFGGNRQISGTEIKNLAEQTVPGQSMVTGVDLTDPAVVRRTLLGEMIAERVTNIAQVQRPNVMATAPFAGAAGADPLTTNTSPEKP